MQQNPRTLSPYREQAEFLDGAIRKAFSAAELSDFAAQVSQSLAGAGVNTWVGFAIAGQEIDVVCERGGQLIGIDLIGYPGEFVEHFSVQTYHALHRAGIHVVPLPYRNWLRDRSGCRERLLGLLREEAGPGEDICATTAMLE